MFLPVEVFHCGREDEPGLINNIRNRYAISIDLSCTCFIKVNYAVVWTGFTSQPVDTSGYFFTFGTIGAGPEAALRADSDIGQLFIRSGEPWDRVNDSDNFK